MTRDPFLDPQDDRLAELFDGVRAAFVGAPAPDVAQRHLAAMVGEVREAPSKPRVRRNPMKGLFATRAVKAFAVALVGLLATGSALAATGNLPDDAQDAVANTVDDVGIHIPGGDDQATETDGQEEVGESEDADEPKDAKARSTEGCPDGFDGKNHGEFVSGSEEQPRNEAARSDCGMPERPTDDGDVDGTDGADDAGADAHRQDAEHRQDAKHREDAGQRQDGEHRQDTEHRPGAETSESS